MAPFRTFTGQGYRIQLDLCAQVLGLDVPEEDPRSGGAPSGGWLYPHPSPSRDEPFVSAALLLHKAKQFDDGLYAAVELAAQKGLGEHAGKAYLLRTLAAALAAGPAEPAEALTVLFASCELGGLGVTVPPHLWTAVEGPVAEFLRDELRSKPLGFYTWSDELRTLFRQNRMLQRELGDPTPLVRALDADERLRATYVKYLELISRLTNPLVRPDLRPFLGGASGTEEMSAFFPAARSHEKTLLEELYGDRRIPDGFDLMDELIRHVRAGTLQLTPTAESGWYDHQLWSLEPLLVPDRMPEARRLRLDRGYREHLTKLFKATYALMRETHGGQGAGGMGGFRAVAIFIAPELTVEPLFTMYLRRALSYRFVRQVLLTTFGDGALSRMNRLTPAGPRLVNLEDELTEIEALFRGAAVVVGRQLGMDSADAGGAAESADAERFLNWGRHPERDVDLALDARMMVPVFYDMHRKKTKVWVFFGWTTKTLWLYFAVPPTVTSCAPDSSGRDRILFTATSHTLWTPVVAEVYVERILDRDEFRRHCDRHKVPDAILRNLR
jgi:hypothetical protein